MKHARHLLFLLAFAACDSRTANAPADSGPEGQRVDGSSSDGTAPNACTVPCGAPKELRTLAELVTQLNAATWEVVGPYTSECAKISSDFLTPDAITLETSSLTLPSSCTAATECRQKIGLQVSTTGVSCDESDDYRGIELCSKVTFSAGARFRVHAEFQDRHPSQYNFVPIVQIAEPCTTPCPSGWLRCEANSACWSSFHSYCQRCLGKGNQVCPCLEASGPRAEGSTCEFAVSGDVRCAGTCQAGRCVSDMPGWAGCP